MTDALLDKVAFVVGGTTGLGLGMAQALASAGAQVRTASHFHVALTFTNNLQQRLTFFAGGRCFAQ
jgi:NAD(P)-dependent dehydrogenase (short-subunit alcohol dehydrogenase family)